MSVRRPWAWPLVPVYGAAQAAREAVRVAGFLPEQHLHWPVISVGSVSAGGAGKTPVTIALATLLAERGWTVDVLSRGYRRGGRGVVQVEPAVEDAAHRFGDEPVLIAERTSVPVWVGRSRYLAGKAAEASAAAVPEDGRDPDTQKRLCAHILDDGFQHRALARQFDLVLITMDDLRDTLLPAGNLRETLGALRRADAFAVREEELDAVGKLVRDRSLADTPIWTVRRSLRFPAPLGVFGAGLRPLAFCALARPENFANMLGKAGCGVVDTVLFADHHRYDDRDMQLLVRLAKQMRATGLVTTEKDAVKLSPGMRARLEAEVGPVVVVPLQARFVYESPVVRTLEQKLQPGVPEAKALGERVH